MIPEVWDLLIRSELQVQSLTNVIDFAPPKVPVLIVGLYYLEKS